MISIFRVLHVDTVSRRILLTSSTDHCYLESVTLFEELYDGPVVIAFHRVNDGFIVQSTIASTTAVSDE